MTSQQVLQSDFIDILFDGRNKLYGAYQLRKAYNTELLKAVVITIATVMSAALLIRPGVMPAVKKEVRERVVVVDQFVLPKEEKKKALPALPTQAKAKRAKQQVFTSSIAITENEILHNLPSQDVLEEATISGSTAGGTSEPGLTPAAPGRDSSGESSSNTQTEAYPEVKPDKQPQFPGGIQAWIAFLTRNLQAPESLESGGKRTVLIRFHVAEDGSVTNFTIVRSAGSDFDNEVIRVLKKMPEWSPAMQAGRPVAVSFTQPVTFVRLEE